MTQCGNDRDVVSIRNTFLVHDIIREVTRNMMIIYISRLHRYTASVGLAKARPNKQVRPLAALASLRTLRPAYGRPQCMQCYNLFRCVSLSIHATL